MKKFLPLLCSGGLAAAACLIPGAALADVKAGVDAWSAGDYAGAVKEWQGLADRGDPDAQFNLAQAYKLGRGVPMNIDKARELYGKAAAQGHVQAADTYGLLLFQSGDREKALPYLQASVARGESRAQYILGVAHFNGDIVPKDWVRAYALVSLAREAGLPQANSALAQMDAHIPLADRQKSVALAAQLAAEAEATRTRVATTTELGPLRPAPASPPLVTALPPVSTGPAAAGADYARPAPPAPVVRKPAPVVLIAPPKPVPPKPVPPKPVPPKPEPAKPAPAAATGGWRVQLGAFGVAGNADALWNRIKGRPELAGHGRLLVPAGRLTKLQAGGFASKAAADAACVKLSAGGFTCIAAQN